MLNAVGSCCGSSDMTVVSDDGGLVWPCACVKIMLF